MLSTAIKNSLLVIVIILILHFLLRRIINEQNEEMSNYHDTREHVTNTNNDYYDQINEQSPPKANIEENECDKAKCQQNEVHVVDTITSIETNKHDDLYNHVFGKKEDDVQQEMVEVNQESIVERKNKPNQTAMSTLIINEFDNENAMNGGELFGNLKGYDMGLMEYDSF
jgi:hypothetical protein